MVPQQMKHISSSTWHNYITRWLLPNYNTKHKYVNILPSS